MLGVKMRTSLEADLSRLESLGAVIDFKKRTITVDNRPYTYPNMCLEEGIEQALIYHLKMIGREEVMDKVRGMSVK
jgi:hypothetical protein